MQTKTYNQLRGVVTFFTGVIVAIATVRDSYVLAAAGVVTALLFLALVRSQTKMTTDERESTIQEKAAKMTYAIFAPTIGITAFLLLLPSKAGLDIFSKGEWVFTESLGMIFAYLTLLLIAMYALCYHFFTRRFGGSNDAE